jgi:hypothetical protein
MILAMFIYSIFWSENGKERGCEVVKIVAAPDGDIFTHTNTPHRPRSLILYLDNEFLRDLFGQKWEGLAY